MRFTKPYAHQKKGPYFLTGTAACAYPTPNGWTWASAPSGISWWRFSVEVSPTDPRYGSPTAGDLRRDRCFFCGERVDPRKSEHYESPETHVLPSSVHGDCVEDYMRAVWTDSLTDLLS